MDDNSAVMRGPNYNWEHEAKHYQDECEKLRELLRKVENSGDRAIQERDAALNALTVTQEEWLLRTKHLENQNYILKNALKQIGTLNLEGTFGKIDIRLFEKVLYANEVLVQLGIE